MSVALYMDQNTPGPVTTGLRRREVEVLTAFADGTDTRANEAMFERATALGRLLFTRDRDFLAIAHRRRATGRDFAGLAYTPQTFRDFGRMIADLELIARAHEPHEDEAGTVHVPSARICPDVAREPCDERLKGMSQAIGPDLHDRFTRGQPLSDEELAALRLWYDQQDQVENRILLETMPPDEVHEARARFLDLMSRLEVVSRRIREVALANEQLRAENRVLQGQLVPDTTGPVT